MLEDLSGRTIGRYKLERRLGRGGMGEVYKATDTTLKRPLALKRLARELSGDRQGRHRFLQEAQRAARLTHQHVAAIHDVVEERGEVFLVMEYVDGQTLREAPARPLDLDTFMEIAAQCSEALVAAHAEGILHRDIKPGNIMLNVQGEVKVLDFGVARELPNSLQDATTRSLESSEEGGVQGTPAYMAPQVLLGKGVDCRADIFSLGIVFYELLTGHHPFLDDTVAGTADRILHETPARLLQLNPRVPEPVEHVVFKMLAKDPDDRYASAADLLVDLRHLKKVHTGEIADWVPREKPARLRKALLLAAAAALLLLGIPLLLSWWRASEEPASAALFPEKPTLAVLPFRADTSDPRDAAFARGLARSVNERLSRLAPDHPFEVIFVGLARQRGIEEPDRVDAELGANLALSGKLSQQDAEHRIDLELVEGGSGRFLARAHTKARLGDSLSLEFQVVEKATRLMGVEVEARQRRQSADMGTDNASAYHLYLRGRGLQEDAEAIARAREQFEEALSLEASFNRARVALARTFLLDDGGKEDVARALQLCSRAELEDPDLVEAQMCLADVWLRKQAPDEAVQHLQKARYHEPLNVEAVERLFEIYRRQRQSREIELLLKQVVDAQPDFWWWHNTLGFHLYTSGRYSEAAEELEKVRSLAPRYYRSLFSLGAAYAQLGDWPRAIEVLESSIAIEPSPRALTNLGTAYFFQGRFKKATEQFHAAVVKGAGDRPQDYVFYGNLAEALYWAPGERDKAQLYLQKTVEMAERARAESPDDPTVLGRLAVYTALLGERKRALRYLEQGLRLAPGHSEMHFRAAQVYRLSRENDRAIASLRAAIQHGLLKEKALNHPLFQELRGREELAGAAGNLTPEGKGSQP